MDWTAVIQKISTPIQLFGAVLASITIVAGDYARITSLNPLALLTVAILGGLGVLAFVVIIVSKTQQATESTQQATAIQQAIGCSNTSGMLGQTNQLLNNVGPGDGGGDDNNDDDNP